MSGHSAKRILLGEAVSRVGLKNICFYFFFFFFVGLVLFLLSLLA
jgi:hypothetical protein